MLVVSRVLLKILRKYHLKTKPLQYLKVIKHIFLFR